LLPPCFQCFPKKYLKAESRELKAES